MLNEFEKIMARFHELESLAKKKKRHDIEAFAGLKKLLIDALEAGKNSVSCSEYDGKILLEKAYAEGVMDGKTLRLVELGRAGGVSKTVRKTSASRDNGRCNNDGFLGKEQTSLF